MEGTTTLMVTVMDRAISCTMSGTTTMRVLVNFPYLTIGNELITSAEVHRSIAEPYWTATFNLAKTVTGGSVSAIFFNPIPVVFFMEDYAHVVRPVFVGFVPTGESTFNSWAGHESFTAHSYAWYLSHQMLQDLPTKRLNVNTLVCMPYHASPGDTSQQNVMYPDDYIKGLLGCNLNCYTFGYGALEGVWYIDDPDERWRCRTNLYPKYLPTPISGGGYTPPPWTQQDFSTKMTPQQAIDRLNQYYRYVSFDKWSYDETNTVYQPDFYWVPFVKIDDGASGLSLPAKVNMSRGSITASDLDNFIVGDIKAEQNGGEKYNFVMIRAQDATGNWMQAVAFAPGSSVYHPIYNPGATAPYTLPIEYYEENPDIWIAGDVAARANDIIAYYGQQVLKYRVTFRKRSDLEPYQLIAVSGYNSAAYSYMADGDYRIIEIRYRLDNRAQTNEVEVTMMKNSTFVAYQNLRRTFNSSLFALQKIIQDMSVTKEQKVYGYLREPVTGPAIVEVVITYNSSATTTQATKRAFYPGAGTLAANQKMMVTVSSMGTITATPVL
jgi:hypothetical protein